MGILDREDLMPSFERRLREADQVDIAVAWVWAGPQLTMLQNAARDKAANAQDFSVRAVVGLDHNGTHPAALRTLSRLAQVRIPHRGLHPGGIFHPKVFIFRSRQGSIAWIGSANFTGAGFLQNLEAIWEVDDVEDADAWFSRLWSGLEADSRATIDDYVAHWEPPAYSSRTEIPLPEAEVSPLNGGKRPDLKSVSGWDSYLDGLLRADRYWRRWSERHQPQARFSVMGRGRSWTDTIEVSGMLARRPEWTGLSDQERHALLGISERDGAYGQLGSMRGAGEVKKLFKGESAADKKTLRRLRGTLDPVLNARTATAVIAAARDALREMTDEPRIGPAVATRLLALARPDFCVSVNAGSAPRLGGPTGLPGTAGSLGTPRNYQRLLTWVSGQPWHGSGPPGDPWQAHIWSMRAALVDCFIYEPV